MMNRIILGLSLGFMMWFSLVFMPSVEPTPRPARATSQRLRQPVKAPPSVRKFPAKTNAQIESLPARSLASIPVTAVEATVAPDLMMAKNLSLADLRRLTFEKHQDLFARLVDPVFKPWAWLVGMQPHRRSQMQNYLTELNQRNVAWSSKQSMASGDRRYTFQADFAIIEDESNLASLKARVDLKISFDGQDLLQTSFEDEARISTQDGRPYAMFDLSECPTDVNEHFAIILMAWPDGRNGQGDFRVLNSKDERWYQAPRASWTELSKTQTAHLLDQSQPSPRSESCAFAKSWH
jgi:hypothetical protein